jgi:hypothetical protein
MSVKLQPDYMPHLLARAPRDEVFFGIGDPRNQYFSDNSRFVLPPGGRPKRNGGYPWAMTTVDHLTWIGVCHNVWCIWARGGGDIAASFTTPGCACEGDRQRAAPDSRFVAAQVKTISAYDVPLDWRSPTIYIFDHGVQQLAQVLSADPRMTAALDDCFGIRACAALGDIVLFAAESLGRNGPSTYLLAFDARTTAFIDVVELRGFIGCRKIGVAVDEKGEPGLYTVMTRQVDQRAETLLMRWQGSAQEPFAAHAVGEVQGFEVVGSLGGFGSGADFTTHQGRLFICTWTTGESSTLVVSQPIPRGGFSVDNPARFTKVLNARDLDPDSVVAETWLLTGIASWGEHLYWGSSHPGVASYLNLQRTHPALPFSPEAVLRSQRRAHLFRTRIDADGVAHTEMVYGDETSWVYQDGQWLNLPNRQGFKPLLGSAGFGRPLAYYVWTLAVHNDSLFIGTFDPSGGFQDLQTGGVLSKDALYAIALSQLQEDAPIGFGLFRMDVPTAPAVAETLDGFGNRFGLGVRCAESLGETLLVCTASASNIDDELAGWHLYELRQH